MSKPDERINAERERRFQALSRLINDKDYLEFIVGPALAGADALFEQACNEAQMPAGKRNDARVVELMREALAVRKLIKTPMRLVADIVKIREEK